MYTGKVPLWVYSFHQKTGQVATTPLADTTLKIQKLYEGPILAHQNYSDWLEYPEQRLFDRKPLPILIPFWYVLANNKQKMFESCNFRLFNLLIYQIYQPRAGR